MIWNLSAEDAKDLSELIIAAIQRVEQVEIAHDLPNLRAAVRTWRKLELARLRALLMRLPTPQDSTQGSVMGEFFADPPWEHCRTEETRHVERLFKEAGYADVAAYRYNAASIRVRVIDECFAHLRATARFDMLDKIVNQLPESTQRDIISVVLLTPQEAQGLSTANTEFESPIPPGGEPTIVRI